MQAPKNMGIPAKTGRARIMYKCPIGTCNREFRQLSALERHVCIVENNIIPLECCFDNCLMEFKTHKRLMKHIISVHKMMLITTHHGDSVGSPVVKQQNNEMKLETFGSGTNGSPSSDTSSYFSSPENVLNKYRVQLQNKLDPLWCRNRCVVKRTLNFTPHLVPTESGSSCAVSKANLLSEGNTSSVPAMKMKKNEITDVPVAVQNSNTTKNKDLNYTLNCSKFNSHFAADVKELQAVSKKTEQTVCNSVSQQKLKKNDQHSSLVHDHNVRIRPCFVSLTKVNNDIGNSNSVACNTNLTPPVTKLMGSHIADAKTDKIKDNCRFIGEQNIVDSPTDLVKQKTEGNGTSTQMNLNIIGKESAHKSRANSSIPGLSASCLVKPKPRGVSSAGSSLDENGSECGAIDEGNNSLMAGSQSVIKQEPVDHHENGSSDNQSLVLEQKSQCEEKKGLGDISSDPVAVIQNLNGVSISQGNTPVWIKQENDGNNLIQVSTPCSQKSPEVLIGKELICIKEESASVESLGPSENNLSSEDNSFGNQEVEEYLFIDSHCLSGKNRNPQSRVKQVNKIHDVSAETNPTCPRKVYASVGVYQMADLCPQEKSTEVLIDKELVCVVNVKTEPNEVKEEPMFVESSPTYCEPDNNIDDNFAPGDLGNCSHENAEWIHDISTHMNPRCASQVNVSAGVNHISAPVLAKERFITDENVWVVPCKPEPREVTEEHTSSLSGCKASSGKDNFVLGNLDNNFQECETSHVAESFTKSRQLDCSENTTNHTTDSEESLAQLTKQENGQNNTVFSVDSSGNLFSVGLPSPKKLICNPLFTIPPFPDFLFRNKKTHNRKRQKSVNKNSSKRCDSENQGKFQEYVSNSSTSDTRTQGNRICSFSKTAAVEYTTMAEKCVQSEDKNMKETVVRKKSKKALNTYVSAVNSILNKKSKKRKKSKEKSIDKEFAVHVVPCKTEPHELEPTVTESCSLSKYESVYSDDNCTYEIEESPIAEPFISSKQKKRRKNSPAFCVDSSGNLFVDTTVIPDASVPCQVKREPEDLVEGSSSKKQSDTTAAECCIMMEDCVRSKDKNRKKTVVRKKSEKGLGTCDSAVNSILNKKPNGQKKSKEKNIDKGLVCIVPCKTEPNEVQPAVTESSSLSKYAPVYSNANPSVGIKESPTDESSISSKQEKRRKSNVAFSVDSSGSLFMGTTVTAQTSDPCQIKGEPENLVKEGSSSKKSDTTAVKYSTVKECVQSKGKNRKKTYVKKKSRKGLDMSGSILNKRSSGQKKSKEIFGKELVCIVPYKTEPHEVQPAVTESSSLSKYELIRSNGNHSQEIEEHLIADASISSKQEKKKNSAVFSVGSSGDLSVGEHEDLVVEEGSSSKSRKGTTAVGCRTMMEECIQSKDEDVKETLVRKKSRKGLSTCESAENGILNKKSKKQKKSKKKFIDKEFAVHVVPCKTEPHEPIVTESFSLSTYEPVSSNANHSEGIKESPIAEPFISSKQKKRRKNSPAFCVDSSGNLFVDTTVIPDASVPCQVKREPEDLVEGSSSKKQSDTAAAECCIMMEDCVRSKDKNRKKTVVRKKSEKGLGTCDSAVNSILNKKPNGQKKSKEKNIDKGLVCIVPCKTEPNEVQPAVTESSSLSKYAPVYSNANPSVGIKESPTDESSISSKQEKRRKSNVAFSVDSSGSLFMGTTVTAQTSDPCQIKGEPENLVEEGSSSKESDTTAVKYSTVKECVQSKGKNRKKTHVKKKSREGISTCRSAVEDSLNKKSNEECIDKELVCTVPCKTEPHEIQPTVESSSHVPVCSNENLFQEVEEHLIAEPSISSKQEKKKNSIVFSEDKLGNLSVDKTITAQTSVLCQVKRKHEDLVVEEASSSKRQQGTTAVGCRSMMEECVRSEGKNKKKKSRRGISTCESAAKDFLNKKAEMQKKSKEILIEKECVVPCKTEPHEMEPAATESSNLSKYEPVCSDDDHLQGIKESSISDSSVPSKQEKGRKNSVVRSVDSSGNLFVDETVISHASVPCQVKRESEDLVMEEGSSSGKRSDNPSACMGNGKHNEGHIINEDISVVASECVPLKPEPVLSDGHSINECDIPKCMPPSNLKLVINSIQCLGSVSNCSLQQEIGTVESSDQPTVSKLSLSHLTKVVRECVANENWSVRKNFTPERHGVGNVAVPHSAKQKLRTYLSVYDNPSNTSAECYMQAKSSSSKVGEQAISSVQNLIKQEPGDVIGSAALETPVYFDVEGGSLSCPSNGMLQTTHGSTIELPVVHELHIVSTKDYSFEKKLLEGNAKEADLIFSASSIKQELQDSDNVSGVMSHLVEQPLHSFHNTEVVNCSSATYKSLETSSSCEGHVSITPELKALSCNIPRSREQGDLRNCDDSVVKPSTRSSIGEVSVDLLVDESSVKHSFEKQSGCEGAINIVNEFLFVVEPPEPLVKKEPDWDASVTEFSPEGKSEASQIVEKSSTVPCTVKQEVLDPDDMFEKDKPQVSSIELSHDNFKGAKMCGNGALPATRSSGVEFDGNAGEGRECHNSSLKPVTPNCPSGGKLEANSDNSTSDVMIVSEGIHPNSVTESEKENQLFAVKQGDCSQDCKPSATIGNPFSTVIPINLVGGMVPDQFAPLGSLTFLSYPVNQTFQQNVGDSHHVFTPEEKNVQETRTFSPTKNSVGRLRKILPAETQAKFDVKHIVCDNIEPRIQNPHILPAAVCTIQNSSPVVLCGVQQNSAVPITLANSTIVAKNPEPNSQTVIGAESSPVLNHTTTPRSSRLKRKGSNYVLSRVRRKNRLKGIAKLLSDANTISNDIGSSVPCNFQQSGPVSIISSNLSVQQSGTVSVTLPNTNVQQSGLVSITSANLGVQSSAVAVTSANILCNIPQNTAVPMPNSTTVAKNLEPKSQTVMVVAPSPIPNGAAHSSTPYSSRTKPTGHVDHGAIKVESPEFLFDANTTSSDTCSYVPCNFQQSGAVSLISPNPSVQQSGAVSLISPNPSVQQSGAASIVSPNPSVQQSGAASIVSPNPSVQQSGTVSIISPIPSVQQSGAVSIVSPNSSVQQSDTVSNTSASHSVQSSTVLVTSADCTNVAKSFETKSQTVFVAEPCPVPNGGMHTSAPQNDKTKPTEHVAHDGVKVGCAEFLCDSNTASCSSIPCNYQHSGTVSIISPNLNVQQSGTVSFASPNCSVEQSDPVYVTSNPGMQSSVFPVPSSNMTVKLDPIFGTVLVIESPSVLSSGTYNVITNLDTQRHNESVFVQPKGKVAIPHRENQCSKQRTNPKDSGTPEIKMQHIFDQPSYYYSIAPKPNLSGKEPSVLWTNMSEPSQKYGVNLAPKPVETRNVVSAFSPLKVASELQENHVNQDGSSETVVQYLRRSGLEIVQDTLTKLTQSPVGRKRKFKRDFDYCRIAPKPTAGSGLKCRSRYGMYSDTSLSQNSSVCEEKSKMVNRKYCQKPCSSFFVEPVESRGVDCISNRLRSARRSRGSFLNSENSCDRKQKAGESVSLKLCKEDSVAVNMTKGQPVASNFFESSQKPDLQVATKTAKSNVDLVCNSLKLASEPYKKKNVNQCKSRKRVPSFQPLRRHILELCEKTLMDLTTDPVEDKDEDVCKELSSSCNVVPKSSPGSSEKYVRSRLLMFKSDVDSSQKTDLGLSVKSIQNSSTDIACGSSKATSESQGKPSNVDSNSKMKANMFKCGAFELCQKAVVELSLKPARNKEVKHKKPLHGCHLASRHCTNSNLHCPLEKMRDCEVKLVKLEL